MTSPAAPVEVRVEARDGAVLSGHVAPGESWYDAALRALAQGGRRSDVPDAVDLSGAEKRFGCAAGESVGYRPMTRADLADLVRWQAQPHVARWGQGGTRTVEAAERRYGGRIDGTEPTRLWVMEISGRSVGWVQDYRIGDHPSIRS